MGHGGEKNNEEINDTVHVPLIRLDAESAVDIPSSLEPLIRRHQRTCQPCKRPDATRIYLTYTREPTLGEAEKWERVTEIGLLLTSKSGNSSTRRGRYVVPLMPPSHREE
jgi:hypothetical protein